jgi:7-keto-8-aminopelargonate synthetase-like enzyme
VGAALAAIDVIRTDPGPRRHLEANEARMREALAAAGISTAGQGHPILAMLLRDEADARSLEGRFRAQGLLVPYFRYASEPRPNLLRAAARAVYTDDQLVRFETAVSGRS